MVVAGGNGPGINDTQFYSPTGIYLDTLTDSLYIANSLLRLVYLDQIDDITINTELNQFQ